MRILAVEDDWKGAIPGCGGGGADACARCA